MCVWPAPSTLTSAHSATSPHWHDTTGKVVECSEAIRLTCMVLHRPTPARMRLVPRGLLLIVLSKCC